MAIEAHVLSGRTFKVALDSDIRRTSIAIPGVTSSSDAFDTVLANIRALFDIKSDTIHVYYVDDKGDRCVLSATCLDALAVVFPEGPVRLCVTVLNAASEPDSNDASAQSGRASVEAADEQVQGEPVTLRSVLAGILRKIGQKDVNVKYFVKPFMQSMDANVLHSLASAGLQNPCMGSEHLQELGVSHKELSALLQTTEPADFRAMILELLDEASGPESTRGAGAAPSPETAVPPNPFADMLGAFANGQGVHVASPTCGAGQAGPAQVNPMEMLSGLLGAFTGGKGGASPMCSAGQSGQAQVNPMEMLPGLLGAFAGGKGFGKGKGCGSGFGTGFGNDFGNDFGKGMGNGCPMSGFMDMFLQGKGCGKGSATTTTTPTTTTTAVAHAAAQEPDSSNAARDAFEHSVADLLDMGLVSDAQVARSLLTQFGDISAVVAMLAEPASVA